MHTVHGTIGCHRSHLAPQGRTRGTDTDFFTFHASQFLGYPQLVDLLTASHFKIMSGKNTHKEGKQHHSEDRVC